MLHVVDRTAVCVPMKPRLINLEKVRRVVLHRLSLVKRTPENPHPVADDKLDAKAVARAFIGHPEMGTGGVAPYTALDCQDGDTEQMLPLVVRGAHAGGYNSTSWSLAVGGNWDEREMPDATWERMIETLSVLAVLPRTVVGHDELKGSSSDPTKRCPGRFVNMSKVRAEVKKRLPVGSETWDIRRRLDYIVRAGFAL
jgi:hypothetical protein